MKHWCIRMRANRCAIVRDLRAKDVRDFLYQECAINAEQLEKIDEDKMRITSFESCTRLCDILQDSDEHAFNCFIKSLNMAGYDHLAELLLNYDINSFDESDHDVEKNEKLHSTLIEQSRRISVFKGEYRQPEKHNKEALEKLDKKLDTVIEQLQIRDIQMKDFFRKYISEDSTDSRPSSSSSWKSEASSSNKCSITGAIAHKISKDSINYIMNGDMPKESFSNKFSCVMIKQIQRLLSDQKNIKHEFWRMITLTKIDEINGYDSLNSIARVLFRDDINWGRIVVFYAFVGWVANFFSLREQTEFTSLIAKFLGNFVDKNLSEWIEKQGGWDEFIVKFDNVSHEDSWYEKWIKPLLTIFHK